MKESSSICAWPTTAYCYVPSQIDSSYTKLKSRDMRSLSNLREDIQSLINDVLKAGVSKPHLCTLSGVYLKGTQTLV